MSKVTTKNLLLAIDLMIARDGEDATISLVTLRNAIVSAQRKLQEL